MNFEKIREMLNDLDPFFVLAFCALIGTYVVYLILG
jgi:hypothetical protein